MHATLRTVLSEEGASRVRLENKPLDSLAEGSHNLDGKRSNAREATFLISMYSLDFYKKQADWTGTV